MGRRVWLGVTAGVVVLMTMGSNLWMGARGRPARWVHEVVDESAAELGLRHKELTLAGGAAAEAELGGESPGEGIPTSDQAVPDGSLGSQPGVPLHLGAPMLARRAELEFESASAARVMAALQGIIGESEGVLMRSRLVNSSDEGYIEARIPDAALEGFLDRARRAAKLRGETRSAEDLGGQYIDVETRLRTGQQLEERLRQLADRTGTVRDVAEVERELARVRAGNERLSIQRQGLSVRVRYATVEIHIAPPPPSAVVETPSMLRELEGAARAGMQQAAATTVLLVEFGVGATPWLVMGGIVIFGLRRLRRERQHAAPGHHLPDEAPLPPFQG